MRTRLFRREYIFPILVIAFISASAHATRDELTAQAAADLHCDSVSLVRSGPGEFLATGCGRDRTYTCDDDDVCTSNDAATVTTASTSSDPDADNAAADAVASALTDMACACASAGLASHGSHSSSSSSHSSKHKSSR